MKNVRPFKIAFDESQFTDLRRRIADTRWPTETKSNDWSLGTPAADLRNVMEYWSNDYDWQRKERELNQYPQYLCKIKDITIHFFHIPGNKPDSTPILMAHGWPDCFLRYTKTFPLLGDYSLVVPSMPGFAFSSLPPVISIIRTQPIFIII